MASDSKLLKIVGLFCKRALSARRYSAEETYYFKEPTNRSHPIEPVMAACIYVSHIYFILCIRTCMWIHLWIYIYTQTYLYDIHTLGARPSDGSMYTCNIHVFCILYIHISIWYTRTYLYDIHTLGARPSDGSMYIRSAHLFCIIYMYIYVNLFNCVYI